MSAPIALCDTAGMTNERWLECRAHGPKGTIPYTVGGSDVAAIFGVSPWTTPLELWMIKKGRMYAPIKANLDQLMMHPAFWNAKAVPTTKLETGPRAHFLSTMSCSFGSICR